jgi:hypothetical protein
MEDRTLTLSSWLYNDKSPVDLAIAITEYLVDNTNWRAPVELDTHVKYPDKYYIVSMGNEEVFNRWERTNYYRLRRSDILREFKQKQPQNVRLKFPNQMLNPYIVDQRVRALTGFGVDVLLWSRDVNFYDIQIRMYYSNLWFSPPSQAEVIWESYQFVRQYQQQGYELNKGAIYNEFDGQSFVPKDELAFKNRQHILNGIVKYIREFSPIAAILTYCNWAKIDSTHKKVSYKKNICYAPPLLYLTPGVTVAPRSRKLFDAAYFKYETDQIEMFLEKTHFGPLVDAQA